MKIIIFSAYWPRPDQVHKATFEVEQAAAFLEAGHRVDVIVPTTLWRPRAKFLGAVDLGLDPARLRVGQIVVPRLPEFFGRYQLGVWMNIWATGRRLRSWMKACVAAGRAPDLIIVHGERNIGLSAGIWNLGEKWKSAMVVHGADPVLEASEQAFLHRRVGPVASSGLDTIILVGNRLKLYARHLGYDNKLIKVIPNGFSHPKLPVRLAQANEEPVRLISVARLVPVKGIDDTLHALSALLARRPDLEWAYDVVGDGPERLKLQALTNELGLTNRVRFLGALPNKDVLKLLEKSAIFALPSWNEAFGLAYLEAMAMGATVVGCLENGAADIITDGVDGCLVPPRNIEVLSAVIEDLIVNSSKRRTLSEAARERVKSFSWSENVRALIEVACSG